MNTLKSIYRFLSKRWQTLHLDYRVDFTPRSSPASGAGLVEIQAILEQQRSNIAGEVERILHYTEQLHAIRKRSEESNPLLPAWNNNFLPGLDMAALYMFIAERRPKKYMEVGSGNSTLVAAAAKNQCSTDTEIISIDPYPRADIDQVSQRIVRGRLSRSEPNGLMSSKPATSCSSTTATAPCPIQMRRCSSWNGFHASKKGSSCRCTMFTCPGTTRKTCANAAIPSNTCSQPWS